MLGVATFRNFKRIDLIDMKGVVLEVGSADTYMRSRSGDHLEAEYCSVIAVEGFLAA